MAHESRSRPLGHHAQMTKQRCSFAVSTLHERFAAQGRFRDCLAATPTVIIDARTAPALSGAASALDMAE